jgi:hypothetical protein
MQEIGGSHMLVAFWGPVHGQVNTTSNMIAIATMLALDHHIRILMTHTHFERSTLEKAYSKFRQADVYRESAGGMDGIQRLVECGMLTKEGVRDNAESLIKDRLDMIAGTSTQNDKIFRKVLPHILEAGQQFYDLIFVDVSSGIRNEISNLVMQYADLIVVNINQNKSVLDTFFSRSEWLPVLDDKKLLYCIGSYQRGSKMSRDRIVKDRKIPKNKVGFIPYNIRYMDSQNEQHVIEYLIRSRSVKKKFLDFNEEFYFAESVRNMGKRILESLEMNASLEEELYD